MGTLGMRHLLPATGMPRRRLPSGLRIYVVGDVHGRADLLTRLFATIDTDLLTRPASHTLHIFLGDYIDRGPSSRQVIDMLLERSHFHELVFLKGNHECCLLQFLENPAEFSNWRQIGGLETLLSYGVAPLRNPTREQQKDLAERFAAALPASHAQFYSRLKLSFSCGDFFFVHAGVRPGIPLDRQREEDMLWIRDDFLLCEEEFGRMIVHGHTPVRSPESHSNRMNIDTGAYITGKLTCLIIENDELAILST
jgi:serine/threonine protein phosphatase 1